MNEGVSRREALKRAALGVLAFGTMPMVLRPLRAWADAPAAGSAWAPAKPWSFGVMGDTQWTCPTDPAGQNPRTVAVSIINQVNQQFIKAGVKFVLQVGDLTNDGRDNSIAQRAAAARALYDAGIGFFPMRGNHETYSPSPNGYGLPALQRSFRQTRGLGDTFGAGNFSSPTSVSADLDGLSYSFDYGPPGGMARFVIIDNWATPTRRSGTTSYPYGCSVAEQQAWISNRLAGTTDEARHQFVLSHQPLMGESHQDCLFDGYTNANPAWQNAFLASLRDADVALYICGHDHIHERSLITSPDASSTVEQLICASNSSKFYTPKPPEDPHWYGQKVRERSLSQERYTVGFYIFTVDGPRVTVDYYADSHGHWLSDAAYPDGALPSQVTPDLSFVKKETWGYSPKGMALLDQLMHRAGVFAVTGRSYRSTELVLQGRA